MTWVRIDDGALHHEKLLAAGPDAITLWLSGLCYANRHTTDGALAKGTLLALYPSETLPPARAKKAAARLVEVGLWLETPSGWCIRNYERYQREAMSVTRDRRREADKASKAEKRGTKSAVDPPTVGAMSDSDTPPTSSRSKSEPSTVETVSAPSRARDPVPARPGPSRPAPSAGESARELERLVCELFGAGYRARTETAWMHPDQLAECLRGGGLRAHDAVRDQVRAIAGWAAAQEHPLVALEGVIEAWFRDPFGERCGYSFAGLAKTVARVAASQPLAPPSRHSPQPALRPEDF